MKNTLVAVGIVGALVLGYLGYTKPIPQPVSSATEGPQGPRGERGLQGPAGKDGKSAPIKVGAATSPDISSPYVSWGDLRHWAYRTISLNQATTTICAIQSPASTSTLSVNSSIQLTVSTSTASILTLAKATTAFATSTVLATSSVAANAQITTTAATTTIATDAVTKTLTIADRIFAPNTWFVVGISGGTGTFSPTGTCEAEWVEN